MITNSKQVLIFPHTEPRFNYLARLPQSQLSLIACNWQTEHLNNTFGGSAYAMLRKSLPLDIPQTQEQKKLLETEFLRGVWSMSTLTTSTHADFEMFVFNEYAPL